MKVTYFQSAGEFRRWLAKHHTSAAELWVGFHKKGSGKPSITWPESVDQALCYGWIDGIRKSVDETRYVIRFSPRRSRSIWSAVNTRRVRELIREELMRPTGLKAFEARLASKSGIYSYEQRSAQLPDPYAKQFKRNLPAWKFYQAQPPWYRKAVNWWVVSAKREVTRLKRLGTLIECSAAGRTVPQLTRPQKPK